jgi:hypothetical protein
MQQPKQSYSTANTLSNEIDKLVHTSLETANIKKLATELHFDVEDEYKQLSDATSELIMLMYSATLLDDLSNDQWGVVAHGAELASLINRCMADGIDTDISKSDVVYYSRRLSEQRKRVGLIQYDDIAD